MRKIETFGTITKEELLHTLNSNILENTFVLESFEPFPGYHGENIPSKKTPHHIFLVTKKEYGNEFIIRKSEEIRRHFMHSFGARPAELHIFNSVLHAIRVKDLPGFELIPELQRWYQDKGIGFMKKRSYNKKGLIRVFKHFSLEELEDGIFKDTIDPLMHYLEISCPLSWKIFESITMNIKNNVDNNNFDAALATVYAKNLMDVVRIYEKDPGKDRLRELRNIYLEEIRKVLL
ncbi:MAG: hypothetical protein GXO83_05650 [Chlorobi bacterium]|nr:hypothetical protein [Chlorobiota bacterium]